MNGVEPLAEQDRPARAGSWVSFLVHFKLGIAALLASLLGGWFCRVGLLRWLVAPTLEGWQTSASVVLPALHFGSALQRRTAYLLVVLGFTWLPAVPFIASDVWRLLRPWMSPRAARLRLAFALASGLVALGVLLLVRRYGVALFSIFVPTDAELAFVATPPSWAARDKAYSKPAREVRRSGEALASTGAERT